MAKIYRYEDGPGRWVIYDGGQGDRWHWCILDGLGEPPVDNQWRYLHGRHSLSQQQLTLIGVTVDDDET